MPTGVRLGSGTYQSVSLGCARCTIHHISVLFPCVRLHSCRLCNWDVCEKCFVPAPTVMKLDAPQVLGPLSEDLLPGLSVRLGDEFRYQMQVCSSWRALLDTEVHWEQTCAVQWPHVVPPFGESWRHFALRGGGYERGQKLCNILKDPGEGSLFWSNRTVAGTCLCVKLKTCFNARLMSQAGRIVLAATDSHSSHSGSGLRISFRRRRLTALWHPSRLQLVALPHFYSSGPFGMFLATHWQPTKVVGLAPGMVVPRRT